MRTSPLIRWATPASVYFCSSMTASSGCLISQRPHAVVDSPSKTGRQRCLDPNNYIDDGGEAVIPEPEGCGRHIMPGDGSPVIRCELYEQGQGEQMFELERYARAPVRLSAAARILAEPGLRIEPIRVRCCSCRDGEKSRRGLGPRKKVLIGVGQVNGNAAPCCPPAPAAVDNRGAPSVGMPFLSPKRPVPALARLSGPRPPMKPRPMRSPVPISSPRPSQVLAPTRPTVEPGARTRRRSSACGARSISGSGRGSSALI